MVVKMTNQEMLDAVFLMVNVLSSQTGKVGYAMTKNTRKLRAEIKEYEEIRTKWIDEHLDMDGRNRLTDEETAELAKAMEPYSSDVSEVDLCDVTPDELASADPPLTSALMAMLWFMCSDLRDADKEVTKDADS